MNRNFLVALFAVLLTTNFASAAEPVKVALWPGEKPVFLANFADERKWDVEVLGTGLADVTNRHVGMGGATIGVGYYFFSNLALQLDLTGYGVAAEHHDAAAVGFTIGLRHHLLNIGKTSLFADVAYGILEASTEVPHGGTHLNNTFYVGPGIAYPLNDNTSLIVGARYYHVSNANSNGRDRNPSVNAVQGVVGLMYRF